MERLTKWNGSKYVLPQGRTKDGKSYWRIVAERLAVYENIGSPEEIEEKLKGANKIKVIVKHPFLRPRLCEIDNTLEEMQMIVGGHIEAYTATPDMAVIGNENGRMYRLPHNCTIADVDWVGTVIVAGVNQEDFTDLPDYLADWFRESDEWYVMK